MKRLYAVSISLILLSPIFSERIDRESCEVKNIENNQKATQPKTDSSSYFGIKACREPLNFNDQEKNTRLLKKPSPQHPVKSESRLEEKYPDSSTGKLEETASEKIDQLNKAKRWILEKRRELNNREAELAKKEKSLEEEFVNRKKMLADQEQLLTHQEQELIDSRTKLTELEQLFQAQEREIVSSKEQLTAREKKLLDKELKCIEKEKNLISKEEELIIKEKRSLQKKQNEQQPT
jgi:hypothetical protein